MREHELTSAMLSDISALIGCQDEQREWIVDTNTRWQDSFVLSGSTVGKSNLTQRVVSADTFHFSDLCVRSCFRSANQRVTLQWRLTPDDRADFAPTGIIDSGKVASNITIPVTMQVGAASLKTIQKL